MICGLLKRSAYCTNRLAECKLLRQCLNQLAAKYSNTKFMKTVSTDSIKNYPDNLLPTLLLYNSTNVKANLVDLRRFGGPKCTPEGEFFNQAFFPLLLAKSSCDANAHTKCPDPLLSWADADVALMLSQIGPVQAILGVPTIHSFG